MMGRVRNMEIELKQEGVLEKVKRIRVRKRKVLKRCPERLVERVYEAEMHGRRGQG